MEWLIGLAAILAAIWAMVEMGRYLDTKEDDPKFRAITEKFGRWLTSQNDQSFTARVRQANELFFHWFDALFHGKGTPLEQWLWLGLIYPLVMLPTVPLFQLVAGVSVLESSRMLLYAMVVAFALNIVVVAHRSLLATSRSLRGVFFFVLFGVLALVLVVVLGLLILVPGGEPTGVLSAGFSQGLPFGLGLGIASGIALVLATVQLLKKIRLPVHPLRSVALSLVSVCVLGAIMREATTSFYHLLLQDGPIVLSFVAFNLFGDAVSLLETRWMLGFSRNRGVLVLPVLVLADLVLSAAIFLFLPLVLGELPSFWENILFRGSRPWLGIFFWSTFATSVLFYLFVATVVLLIVPGHGLARLFHRTVGRMITIESRPFTAIALGMSLLLLFAVAAMGLAGAFLYHPAAS